MPNPPLFLCKNLLINLINKGLLSEKYTNINNSAGFARKMSNLLTAEQVVMEMFYPQELIDEIRMQNDIVSVISEYITLKPKGISYFGL